MAILNTIFSRALAGALAIGAATQAPACTRVLWNDSGLGVVVGRTMDWPESTEPLLTVFPRGTKHDGGKLGPAQLIEDNALTWSAKYGSIVTTVYGLGAADGVNERGLAAHMLFLNAADFGPRDPGKPSLHAGLWAQYVLDEAETVNEALALLEKVQLVMAEARGTKTTVHLAIEDASGDSAIVEYVGGKPLIHHGRQFKIMTNDPPYDQQLALLAKLDFSNPTSDTPLPGNVNPRDRFARAAYFTALLPKPKSEREAVAGMLAIARNVSVPFAAPYKGFGIYNTEYRTVTDLGQKLYFFELTTRPNVIWADLTKFDLRPGAPVRTLDPNAADFSGDVSGKFKRAKSPPY
jgi:choloylglycine hydrolase